MPRAGIPRRPKGVERKEPKNAKGGTTNAVSKKKKKNMNDHRRMPEHIVRHDTVCINFSKPSTTSRHVSLVSVFTDHNHDNLRSILERYAKGRIVLVCVPWLTSDAIIGWLSKFPRAVHVIVNREDYGKWGNGCVTPQKYAPLKGSTVPFRHIWGNRIETPLNQLKRTYTESVRCYGDPSASSEGESSSGKKKNTAVFMPSIMHSKYMVICDDSDMPRYLWCGSMNFTANSNNNQELNLFLDDPALAMHMFLDFGLTFIKSETLSF